MVSVCDWALKFICTLLKWMNVNNVGGSKACHYHQIEFLVGCGFEMKCRHSQLLVQEGAWVSSMLTSSLLTHVGKDSIITCLMWNR